MQNYLESIHLQDNNHDSQPAKILLKQLPTVPFKNLWDHQIAQKKKTVSSS